MHARTRPDTASLLSGTLKDNGVDRCPEESGAHEASRAFAAQPADMATSSKITQERSAVGRVFAADFPRTTLGLRRRVPLVQPRVMREPVVQDIAMVQRQ